MSIRSSRKTRNSRAKSVAQAKHHRDLRHRRGMLLETLESRRVMAVGPTLAGIQPNNGSLLTPNAILKVGPQDLLFNFTNEQGFKLDPSTLNGIQLIRSGFDGDLNDGQNVIVTPGYIGIGDTGNEVVMRFSEPLPDDKYRVIVFGTTGGPDILEDTAGNAFQAGRSNFTLPFDLDLGAQIVSVVPQPVDRNATTGALTQRANEIDVYFNDDDLNVASATNRNFYKLILTKNTATPTDDVTITPTSVVYSAATDKATLKFSKPLNELNPNNYAVRLRVGTDEAIDTATYTPVVANEPSSTFGGALNVGPLTGNKVYTDSISAKPYDIQFPGGNDDPGHRDNPIDGDKHLADGAEDNTDGVSTVYYNFKKNIGSISNGQGGSQPAFNLITENQKQRVREVFDLFSRYAGIQFIESQDQGITVATGDLRVIDPLAITGPGVVRALASQGRQLAIMDSGETDWDDLYGGNYFQAAMHEIGHVLGMGDSYDLPELTVQGDDPNLQGQAPAAEPVFPGDNDIVHLQRLYRPEGQDIDMYRFVISAGQNGVFSAEVIAERLQNGSNLDSYLRLYKDGPNGRQIVAINDDYFSKDSSLELELGPGTYYIGVSAKGNDSYDPTIADSGIGGTTEGEYRLRLNFRPTVSTSRSIVDATGTPFDGDLDGNAGGVYDFWFKTAAPLATGATGHTKASTIFVDKSAPNGGNGSLARPFNRIPLAVAAATVAGDIIRILGNGGADKKLDTLGDNLAYQIGFEQVNNTALPDGSSLIVPKNVTVMVDAGAVFQMRRSRIQVGSAQTTASTDRSGASLQVLGTPNSQVVFTSYNDQTIGRDTNPLNTVPSAGDWGGILFRNDQDRADGRFDWEEHGVFLNYVNNADFRYGGGQVNLDGGQQQVIDPIHMVDARPTVSFNTITRSADAAMSASPNSFEETTFREARYQPDGTYARSFNVDYTRIGPAIYGNHLVVTQGSQTFSNTINGLFVRASTPAGNQLQELTVTGRFDDTTITHVVAENLVISGTPGGPTLEGAVPNPADPTIDSGKPPLNLVIVTPKNLPATSATPGQLTPGATYRYRIVYIDKFGNEGRASDVRQVTLTGSNNAVQFAQLPIPPANSGFVARRLYRAGADGLYKFVEQIPSTVTSFVDTGAVATFDRNLNSGLLNGPNGESKFLARPRPDATLKIDPNIIVKSDTARIEVEFGATLIAEGLDGQEIVFTSLSDDRYGAGGTFDARGDGRTVNPPNAGEWGGIYAFPNSRVSIDQAEFFYGGGLTRVEGNFAGFNVIDIEGADARIANSLFQFNANGTGGTSQADRFGRGFNAQASIFIRGAQPIIVNNIIRNNLGGAMNINVNALNSEQIVDLGRQSGNVARVDGHLDNNGPLIVGNRLSANGPADAEGVNGLIVRGGVLTTEGVWDDTDIAHVIFDQVAVTDFHSYGGLRLESSPVESLVVKAFGDTAGFYANGRPLEIDDRIGGALQILGQPGFPVVLTSLRDDSVSAGFTPNGGPNVDTNNDGSSTGGGGGGPGVIDPPLPPPPPNTGELQITPTGNATTLVNAMLVRGLPGGVTIPTSVYTGDPTASGTYINGDGVPLGIYPTGAILTSGDANLPTSNTDTSFGTINTGGSDPDLAIIANQNINDAAVLTITINVTAASGIRSGKFDFQFGSDEFSEFVGTPFNDVFGGFINGGATTNFIRDSLGNLVTINNGFFNIDNEGDVIDIEYDGLTSGLTASFPLNVGTNVLKLAVGDAFDSSYDSGAFITDLRFSTEDVGEGGVDTVTPASAGDWAGITIDKYAHDRNVDTILEQEDPTLVAPGSNAEPITSQALGLLSPTEKGGDENRRLGFTVNGLLNVRNDVDVYSFRADAQTEVWIDIDRTNHALDTIVELVDADGVVLASSNDSEKEEAGTTGLNDLVNPAEDGVGLPMTRTPPFEGRDFYTTNPRDAGMRVVLPGPQNTTAAYFVRVRSNSTTPDNLNSGLTSGAYKLQIRLQEKDEIGGSVIRLADIRSAENGIQVLGQPTHSPLLGEHGDVDRNGGSNNTLGTAQNIGNAAAHDRGTVSIAGNLANAADVDWYQFTVDLQGLQGDFEVAQAAQTLYSMMFDIDYADGFARPNTTLNVFNAAGQLILSSRDSNVADDRPSPTSAADIEDLLRGSAGAGDPLLGPAYLPTGANNDFTAVYYVAVSSDAILPAQYGQFFQRQPVNPLFRLEPINSVKRIAEDHIGEGAGTGAERATGSLADVQVLFDNTSAVPFNLGDVTLFVQRRDYSNISVPTSQVLTVDPFTGAQETVIGSQAGRELEDIAFRSDNQLFAYAQDVDDPDFEGLEDAESGLYIQIDTGNGANTQVGASGITTFERAPGIVQAHLVAGARVGYGVQFEALAFGANVRNNPGGFERLFAVGNRGEEYLLNPTNDDIAPKRNLIYQMNPGNGAALSVGGPGATPNSFGALTSAFELGEVLTAPTLITIDATTYNVAAGTTIFNILDGTGFTIAQGTGNVPFEFDAGPEVRQNINIATTSTIRDGNYFILDPDRNPSNNNEQWFQFDTGSVINVANPSTAINDGATVSIADTAGRVVSFELDRDGNQNNANAVLVDITGNVSQLGVAGFLATAINGEFAAGTFGVQATVSGNRISLTGDQNVQFSPLVADAMSLSGASGGAPILQAVPGNQLVDGQTFTINRLNQPTRRFEFDSNGVVAPGNTRVPFTAAQSSQVVSNNIVTALTTALGTSVTVQQVGDRIVISGQGPGNNTTGNNLFLQGTSPIVNLLTTKNVTQILAEETFNDDTIGITVQSAVEQNSNFSVGADGSRINFPPFRDLSHTPVLDLNADGVPVWNELVGSATGTAGGAIGIPFRAEEDSFDFPLTPPRGNVDLPRVAISERVENAIDGYFGSNQFASRSGDRVYLDANGRYINIDTPLTAQGLGPGGNITGITIDDPDNDPGTINSIIYAVSDAGGFYQIDVNTVDNVNLLPDNPARVQQVTTTYIAASRNDLEGIEFQAITKGPETVENGRYRDMFFGITGSGRMYAFNRQGELQKVFADGATFVETGLTDVRGLAFSSQESNNWGYTTTRGDLPGDPVATPDPGHGVNPTEDQSRSPLFYPTVGATSLHFGNYNAPGGAYGTTVTNEFSLVGYSASDQPYLYFNYFLASEEVYDILNHFQLRDSVRVFISGSDPENGFNSGDWQQISADDNIDQLILDGSDAAGELGARMYDNTGTWRQVRIPLGEYAGLEHLRLRFDFSTAADMALGDTFTTGEELRAVAGKYIKDGDTITIDDTNYEFQSGYTIVAPAGASIKDGDTFTITKNYLNSGVAATKAVTFEFNAAGGVTGSNFAIPVTRRESPAEIARLIVSAIQANFGQVDTAIGRAQSDSVIPRSLGDNRVNVDFASIVTRLASSALTLEGSNAINPGNVPISFDRTMTREEVAVAIDGVLEASFYDQTLRVEATGDQYHDGDTIQVTANGVIYNFEFETGFVINMPSGGGIPTLTPHVNDGDTITFDHPGLPNPIVFEWDSNGALNNATHRRVAFSTGDIQLEIADALRIALNTQTSAAERTTMGINNPQIISGSRLQIFGNAGLTFSTAQNATFSVSGQPGLQSGQTRLTAIQHVPSSFAGPSVVAQELATAFDLGFTNFDPTPGNPADNLSASWTANDPSRVSLSGVSQNQFVITSDHRDILPNPPNGSQPLALNLESASDIVKTYKDLIRIIGHNVTDRGPLGLDTALPNDSGNFFSNVRGQNNAFEGVYIDDLIIGFAERGEMGTGATVDASFITNPFNVGGQINAGDYQLEMRRGPDFNLPSSFVALPSMDTNDRLNQSLTFVAPAGADIADGKTFTISDGLNRLTFEFNVAGNTSTVSGNVVIPYNINDTAVVIGRRIRDAINGPSVQAVLQVSAQLADGSLFGELTAGDFPGRLSNSVQVNLIGAVSLQPLGEAVPEPNDTTSKAVSIDLTQTPTYIANGTIGDSTTAAAARDVDLFKLTLAANQTIYIDIDADQFGSTLDSHLRIFNSAGAVIPGQVSGDRAAPGEKGDTKDSYLVFRAPSAGVYYIGVSGRGNQVYNPNTGGNTAPGTQGTYQLEISSAQPSSTEPVSSISTVELTESNDNPAAALLNVGLQSVPFSGTGDIIPLIDPVDLVPVSLVAGVKYYINVDAAQFGSLLDTRLRVLNSAGVSFANNDDGSAVGETPNLDSYLEFTPTVSGTYFLEITAATKASANRSEGQFKVAITAIPPNNISVKVANESYGDNNLFRDQGQIILDGNRVSNSAQWGILIDDGARDNGSGPHTSPTRILRETNVQRLTPGVVVMNNVVFDNLVGGIRYSGSDNPAGTEVGSVPFGRIINNTVVGLGGSLVPGGTVQDVGIRVDQNASPTLLNNIVANFATGVFIDPTSTSTVLGGFVFQGNLANTNPANLTINSGFNLTLSEPLFVDPTKNNYYLAPGSRAIDSSIDSLLDRAALVTVRNPLGIPQSPILAPSRDSSGQLRVDDPNVDSPGGSGENVFKDRGAIDRVDFEGPMSELLTPRDNDDAGLDGDPTPTVVVLPNIALNRFEIQLNDAGIGIDDDSVTSSSVLLDEIIGNNTRRLVDGTDYIFSYDRTNNKIILTPSAGIWPLARNYRITLDNSAADASPAIAIRDIAGNLLQPNRTTGIVRYEIFLGTAIDWGDLPNTYLTTNASNGPSHQIRAGLSLGALNNPDSDGQPSAQANRDTGDDGLIRSTISPGSTSSLTVLANGTGKLDAWLDYNKNGKFEANEKLTFLTGTPGGGVNKVLTFKFGAKGDPTGNTGLRLRWSSAGIATPTGAAPDGEVEDYIVTMVGPPFQNPNLRWDVDGDGNVTSRDALLIVNLLNNKDTDGDGSVDPVAEGLTAPPYYDVDGNNLIQRRDALDVIDYLNQQQLRAASPAAKSAAATSAASSVAFASSSIVYEPAKPATQTAAVDQVFAASATSTKPASTATSTSTKTTLASATTSTTTTAKKKTTDPVAGLDDFFSTF